MAEIDWTKWKAVDAWNAIAGYDEGAWVPDNKEHIELIMHIKKLLVDRKGWITVIRLIAQGNDRGAAIAHGALQSEKNPTD